LIHWLVVMNTPLAFPFPHFSSSASLSRFSSLLTVVHSSAPLFLGIPVLESHVG